VINGMHGIIYVPNPEEVRTFIRDKLGFAHNDIGEGWLIFDMREADLGVHPSDNAYRSISFYCNDIHKTVEELRLRGVEFSSGITDEGGLLTHFRMLGGWRLSFTSQGMRSDLLARSQGLRRQPEHDEGAESASSVP